MVTVTNGNIPVKSKTGEAICRPKQQNKRWMKHFAEVLNQPPQDDPFDFQNLPVEKNNDINCNFISTNEVRKAIHKLKNDKAPEIDGIQPEMMKYADDVAINRLRNLLNLFWSKESVPNE